jgi:hypothetical protein
MPQVQALAAVIPYEKSRYEDKNSNDPPGEVQQWSRYLRGKASSPKLQELRSARMAAAGTARAFAKTVFSDSAVDVDDLRKRSVEKMMAAGPPGVRSSTAAGKAKGEPGRSLLAALKNADSLIRKADESPR